MYPAVPVGHSRYELMDFLRESRIKILKILKDKSTYSERDIIRNIPSAQLKKMKNFLDRLTQANVLKAKKKTKKVFPNIYKITEVTYKLDCNIIFI
jgi:hypothetical protein